jgi:hypothetical protein
MGGSMTKFKKVKEMVTPQPTIGRRPVNELCEADEFDAHKKHTFHTDRSLTTLINLLFNEIHKFLLVAKC